MIELCKVNKKYGDLFALKDVSLKLPNRGLVAIYGENGCGKTTLLNLLSTLDTDYVGEIKYNGTDYKQIISKLRRNVISFVLQENQFISYLDVSENLLLSSEREDMDEITRELKLYNIEEKKNENPKNLSGGQRQRTSLIRGLIKPAEILLVDEPTSSLNEEMEQLVFERLQNEAKEKLVVIVSHNIRLIRMYSDLIIHMEKGEIETVEYNSREGIRYEDNCVLLPLNDYNLSGLGPVKVKGLLQQYGEFVVKADSEGIPVNQLDYEEYERTEWKPSKKLSRYMENSMMKNSLKHIKSNLLLQTGLICFFGIMISFLLSFAYFDTGRFIYENLTKNVDGYISYSSDESDFSVQNYKFMKENFSSNLLLLDTYEECVYLPFEERDMYMNMIHGRIFFGEDDITLVFGKFPEEDEVLLTDYLAKGLIAGNTEYSDFQSIVDKGIVVSDVRYKVSGIVDTDYEKYDPIWNSEEFINSQVYIDYQRKMNDVYGRLYFSYEEYSKSRTLYYTPIRYGEFFSHICEAKILEQEIELKTPDSCVINKTLYEKVGMVEELKLNTDYLVVDGIVEDNSTEDIIYVSTEKMEAIKESQMGNISRLLIDINSQEETEYLAQSGMNHSCSVSSYIKTTIDIITIAQRVFFYIFILMSIFLFIAIWNLVCKIFVTDKLAIMFLNMSGYESKSIFLLQVKKIFFMLILSCVGTTLLFITSSGFINWILSDLYGRSIYISLVDISTIIMFIFINSIAFLGGTILGTKKYLDKNLITLK